MEQINKAVDTVTNQRNHHSSGPSRPATSLALNEKRTAVTLSNSPEARKEIDALLLVGIATQKTYGKSPDDIGTIQNLFHKVLADYPADKVEKAMRSLAGDQPRVSNPCRYHRPH